MKREEQMEINIFIIVIIIMCFTHYKKLLLKSLYHFLNDWAAYDDWVTPTYFKIESLIKIQHINFVRLLLASIKTSTVNSLQTSWELKFSAIIKTE